MLVCLGNTCVGNGLKTLCVPCCRIQQAGQEAQVLALSSFSAPSVAAACVCFLELLGLDSLRLRVDVRVGKMIFSHRTRNEASHHNQIRDSLGKGVFVCFGIGAVDFLGREAEGCKDAAWWLSNAVKAPENFVLLLFLFFFTNFEGAF